MTTVTTPNKCGTLADRLAEGPTTYAETLRYAVLLAEALRSIHEGGRVHGAVSPDVVFLNETDVDLLSGSPSELSPYAAPEQREGHPASPASDIFSFGTVFLEMLANCSSGSGSPAASARAAADSLAKACTATEPGARLQSMDAILRELQTIAAVTSAESPEGTENEPPPEPPPLAFPQSAAARIDALERELGLVRRDNARLERELSHASLALQNEIRDLSSAIESVRAYVAETDLLAERVVEAMEAVRNKFPD